MNVLRLYPPRTPMVVIARDLERMGYRLTSNLRSPGYAVRRRSASLPPSVA